MIHSKNNSNIRQLHASTAVFNNIDLVKLIDDYCTYQYNERIIELIFRELNDLDTNIQAFSSPIITGCNNYIKGHIYSQIATEYEKIYDKYYDKYERLDINNYEHYNDNYEYDMISPSYSSMYGMYDDGSSIDMKYANETLDSTENDRIEKENNLIQLFYMLEESKFKLLSQTLNY
jgi:hypothetical protein